MGRKPFRKYIKNELFSLLDKDSNEDPNNWRLDRKGRKITKGAYGDRSSKYGWNIHHIDGDKTNNDISNLEALHYDSHDEEHNN